MEIILLFVGGASEDWLKTIADCFGTISGCLKTSGDCFTQPHNDTPDQNQERSDVMSRGLWCQGRGHPRSVLPAQTGSSEQDRGDEDRPKLRLNCCKRLL